jgi:GNAT superfamily N-acetyltransferase
MQIVSAEEKDIPEIVSLLKSSLGESLMPKSEAYWRWKHIQNPFGPSPVLIARENDMLVGVRAFMRWQWRWKGEILNAVRAVDTATHPDYQGKGIFKKLTLALVDKCKERGDHFVFNTPNSSSKPGYLKMGWQETGKLPITFCLCKPIGMAMSLAGRSSKLEAHNAESLKYFLGHAGLQNLISDHLTQSTNNIATNYSMQYLRWRYLDVTVADYEACGYEESGSLKALMFFRLKESRAGNELRITDLFIRDKNDAKFLWKELVRRMNHHHANYVTLSGRSDVRGFFLNKLSLKFSLGPSVTVRDLAMDIFPTVNHFNNWTPSLGDLELF